MVNVVLQGACELYHNKKDEGNESLPLLAFQKHVVNAAFLKSSKESRLSSSHWEIRNIPSDFCYDYTKYYLLQSEHRRIRNLFKHLRWSVLAQRVNSLKLLTGYAKVLHPRRLKGFWIGTWLFFDQWHFSLLKNKTGVRCAKRTLYTAT